MSEAISKYASYFHDGSIIAIKHVGNEISISMESAEMDPEDLTDELQLSKSSTLKGILHLKGVKNIFVDKQPLLKSSLVMLADTAGILDLKVSKNDVHLFLEWIDYPPKQKIEKYTDIIIQMEDFFWENIPDLYDPYN